MTSHTWNHFVLRYQWPLAIITAALLGLIEGALTNPTGAPTPISRATYWTILFSLPMLGLSLGLGIPRALAYLPLVIVVQDWFSLVASGKEPRGEYWYTAVFGDHILTQHAAYLPNFYYIGFAATFAAHVALDFLQSRVEAPDELQGPTTQTV